MALPPFPVPERLVPLYGRGRRYFPEPVEFQVPLLCAMMHVDTPLYYYIIDVSLDWEMWTLALPQSPDNHVMCYSDPVDAQGHRVPRAATHGYKCWTIAELRRRITNFWSRSAALMQDGTWMPMELADPFNLLGFTCLPMHIRSVDVEQLPPWKMHDSLTVTYIKPVYVNTPVNAVELESYETVDLDVEQMSVGSSESSTPSPILEAFVIGDGSAKMILKTVKEAPTIANMRIYLECKLRQRAFSSVHISVITSAYYLNDSETAYLCTFKNIADPIWVSSRLLELLEVNDLKAYCSFRKALDLYQETLES